MNGLRRLGSLTALVAALHTSVLSPAFAAVPSPPSSPSPAAAGKPATAGSQTTPDPHAPDLVARAQELFEDQQYEESIQTLSGVLVRPNNTKAEKVAIYRLLALNYITLTQKEEAEGAVRGLLALEPTYELPERESPRFRDFFAAAKQKWEAEGRPGLVKETEPPPAPVTMKHVSPAQATAGTQIDLSVRLEDPQARVRKVVLYYRSGTDVKFEQAPADLAGGRATASIPPTAVKPPIVEYYVQGLDKGGLPIVARGDAAAPLRIAIPDKTRGWIVPVVVAGAVAVVAGGLFGGLAAAGVFNKSAGSKGAGEPGQSTVSVSVGSSSAGVRW